MQAFRTFKLLSSQISPPRRLFQPGCIQSSYYSTMKALIYKSIGSFAVEERPIPKLTSQTDALIKMTKTTICGTDLHIRKGDVPTCKPGRIIGHEGVGVIEEVGDSVKGFRKGDRVLISCISSCSTCEYCKKGMSSHCTSGGWVLGNTIDGTQAEYVRIPHADSSLYPIPPGVSESAIVMLSDLFPTGLECGVLNSKISPGSTVAIVGAGPIGLAAMITAQLYSPSAVIMIDMDENRLKISKEFGATHTVVSGAGAVEKVMEATGGRGCDAVIEAVGIPATFEMAQSLLAVGGVLANVGVHGKPVSLHLENLWDKNISITTRLVDAVSTPMLLKLLMSGKLDAEKLITHKFAFKDVEKAYETFGAAAKHDALKVLIEM